MRSIIRSIVFWAFPELKAILGRPGHQHDPAAFDQVVRDLQSGS